MNRPDTTPPKGQYPLAEFDLEAFAKSPALRSFFMDADYGDGGGSREQGSLMLRPESNRWTATLKEPTTCSMLYLAAPTLKDLWKLVEAALADPKCPWVEDTWAKARRSPTPRKRG